MSVKKDASGKSWVEVQVELPGTPEEVWHAIATGPGMTAWFVPTEVEEKVHGKMVFHLMPGMDSVGIVTAWEPPVKLNYEERGWNGDAPPLATEVHVEAKSGGTCIVRMVHSLFASREDWDQQLESMEAGWVGFFDVLRLYLTHFAGQAASNVRLAGNYSGPAPEGWRKLLMELGLVGISPEQAVRTAPTGLLIAGVVEKSHRPRPAEELLLRLNEPAPGLGYLAVQEWAGQVHVTISFYFYGATGAVAAPKVEADWTTWLQQHFPVATPASGS